MTKTDYIMHGLFDEEPSSVISVFFIYQQVASSLEVVEMEEVQIIKADFDDLDHCESILFLLDCYAGDLMGGGESLSEFVKENLIK